MNFPSSPDLLLQGSIAGLLTLLLGGVLLLKQRTMRVTSALALSMGFALCSILVLVVSVYGFHFLQDLSDSVVLILGVPITFFLVAFGIFVHRGKLSVLSSLLGAAIGLVGLYYVGGSVLMLSACRFVSAGC